MEIEKNKNNKTLLIIIVIIILLASFGLFYVVFMRGGSSTISGKLSVSVPTLDLSTTPVYSISDRFADEYGQNWLFGYYSAAYFGASITDGTEDSGYQALIDLTATSNGEDVREGDLIMLYGAYNESYIFVASEVYVLSEKDIDVINSYKYPYADIELKNHTKSLEHGCSNYMMDVKITNTGNRILKHEDFYSMSTSRAPFAVIQVVNGEDDIGYSYNESAGSITQGLAVFDPIEPGESVNVKFSGGGYVNDGCSEDGLFCGTSGNPNMFCGSSTNPSGSKDLQLKFGYLKADSYSEYIYTAESNAVTINVSDCDCQLD